MISKNLILKIVILITNALNLKFIISLLTVNEEIHFGAFLAGNGPLIIITILTLILDLIFVFKIVSDFHDDRTSTYLLLRLVLCIISIVYQGFIHFNNPIIGIDDKLNIAIYILSSLIHFLPLVLLTYLSYMNADNRDMKLYHIPTILYIVFYLGNLFLSIYIEGIPASNYILSLDITSFISPALMVVQYSLLEWFIEEE